MADCEPGTGIVCLTSQILVWLNGHKFPDTLLRLESLPSRVAAVMADNGLQLGWNGMTNKLVRVRWACVHFGHIAYQVNETETPKMAATAMKICEMNWQAR